MPPGWLSYMNTITTQSCSINCTNEAKVETPRAQGALHPCLVKMFIVFDVLIP